MSDLMITGVIDGPLTGGLPKAIQLIALQDIPDLSIYGLGSANNGGGTDGEEFTFPATAVTAGTVIYVSQEETGFTSFFGFAPDYTSPAAQINGDDAIELFQNGSLVDIFGDPAVDGTGQTWEYLDGWASREPSEGPSATFTLSEWSFSGPNALDGETTNGAASSPFPTPSLTPSPAPIVINEYRFTATEDFRFDSNFVELKTAPGATFEGLTLVIINGENQTETDNAGQITWAVDLSGATADENGILLIGNDQLTTFDDGDVVVEGFNPDGNAQTILVVRDFTGAVGDDLDADDDGALDNPPFTEVVVGLALEDEDFRPDFLYAEETVQADPLATGFISAGAALQPDGSYLTLPYDTPDQDTPGAPNVATPPPPPPPPFEGDVAINEYRVAVDGPEAGNNFVELKTDPGKSLTGLTLIAISGEIDTGEISLAYSLDGAVADENGFLLISDGTVGTEEAGDVTIPGLDIFGSPKTFMVVDGFTGSVGDDLDTNDDGTLDTTPFTSILDSVAFVDGDANPDTSYSSTVVAADGNFSAAGAAREVDGTGAFVPLSFFDTSQDTPGSANAAEPPVDNSVTIMEIQGAGHTSPLLGQDVTTSGIVTAVDSNGFYMQDPDGDGDIATSDAIFVFTGSAPSVVIGDAVDVSGTVSEFTPGGSSSGNLSTTQISGGPAITVTSSGNALPTATVLGAAGRDLPTENIDDDAFASFDPTTDGIDFWESLEGMFVVADNPVAVSGTSRFGELFVAVDGGANATGLSDRGTLNISPDDFNPEKVQIDWDFGIDPVQVSVGAAFDDIFGVVSYDFGYYQINPTEQIVTIEDSTLAPEVSEITSGEETLTIASYNVLNLDPEDGDGDADIANGRFDEIASQIVNNMNAPDIIGLQEIQDNNGTLGGTGTGIVSADVTLQTLIDAIVAAGGPTYSFIDNTFIGEDLSGGFPGGNIRTAFLYNADRVDLIEGTVQTIGGQGEGDAFEGARLPLVADFAFNGEEFTVVNNHFSSKGGSAPILGVEQPFEARQEDVTVNGSLDERQAQAAAVAEFVEAQLAADPDANVVVVGDFNEFEFVSPLTALEAAGLTNLTNTLPEDERYSFNFQGNSQSLDHILVSSGLESVAAFDIVHVNSEFAELPGRASDHDPLIVGLTVPLEPVEPIFVVQMGTDGNDVLRGGKGQADALIGKDGNDSLFGRDGNDLLIDGLGNDRLRASQGDDILVFEGGANDRGFTGAGSDIIRLSDDYTNNGMTDRVKIVDFNPDEDLLDLAGAVVASVMELNKETRIVLAGEGDMVVLRGVTDFDDIVFTSIDLPDLDMSADDTNEDEVPVDDRISDDEGDTGGGNEGQPGDVNDVTGLVLSTLTDGQKLRGTESDDVFSFFGTANAVGAGGADTFVMTAAMFENGSPDKVQIRDYNPDDTVDLSGFAISEVKELNNRVQVFVGPDHDLLEFVNLTSVDEIVFVTDLPLA